MYGARKLTMYRYLRMPQRRRKSRRTLKGQQGRAANLNPEYCFPLRAKGDINQVVILNPRLILLINFCNGTCFSQNCNCRHMPRRSLLFAAARKKESHSSRCGEDDFEKACKSKYLHICASDFPFYRVLEPKGDAALTIERPTSP